MSVKLRAQKIALARLLAEENIAVQESKNPSPAFDVSKRILYLPALRDDTSSDVYDLFVGHEVSHALNTPADFSQQMLKVSGKEKMTPMLHDCWNIIEDVRIEKRIREHFPGLVVPFARAYATLHHDEDFFKLDGKDVNSLSFGDRLNIHFKLGDTLDIKFSPEEQAFVDEVGANTVVNAVYDLAYRLYQMSKEELKDQSGVGMTEDCDATVPDGSIFCSIKELAEALMDAGQLSKFSSGSISGSIAPLKQNNILNIRQEREYVYLVRRNIPLVTSKHIALLDGTTNWDNMMAAMKPSIDFLVQQFQRKKKAALCAKERIAISGALDMNRLHKYKFSDDVFLRTSSIPHGQNHGLVGLVDFSASMQDNIVATVTQAIALALFAHRVNVPCVVYGFTGNTETPAGLFKLIDNRCKRQVFMNNLANLYESVRQKHLVPTGGTPLLDAIYQMRDVIDDFKQATSVSNITFMILTDGEGNGSFTKRGFSRDYVVVDRSLGMTWDVTVAASSEELESVVLETIRRKHNAHIVGFYLDCDDKVWTSKRMGYDAFYHIPAKWNAAESTSDNQLERKVILGKFVDIMTNEIRKPRAVCA